MAWRDKNPTTKLLFGTGNDLPDTHDLEICKETAKRAGLTGNWYLHRWRSSFATMSLRAGADLSTVQHWLGHSSILMTQRYLSPDSGQKAQQHLSAAFGFNLNRPVLVAAG
jgi:site-specific recombinase XerD